jgi:hypothetical protein
MANGVSYSDPYYGLGISNHSDDSTGQPLVPMKYRHVIIPQYIMQIHKQILDTTLTEGTTLTEDEWRNIGIQQSANWQHYAIHAPEKNILLFKKDLSDEPGMKLSEGWSEEAQEIIDTWCTTESIVRIKNVSLYDKSVEGERIGDTNSMIDLLRREQKLWNKVKDYRRREEDDTQFGGPARSFNPTEDTGRNRIALETGEVMEEHLLEFFLFIKGKEEDRLPNPNYMVLMQTKINEEMRAILIDWINSVSTKFKLLPETLYMTVNLIDRYLSLVNITLGKLQLVGVTAMLIASKYEEIYQPRLDVLSDITSNSSTIDQIVKMEVVMLKTLEFKLESPSPRLFLDTLFQFIPNIGEGNTHHNIRMLSNYILELSLLDYNMIKYIPSVVASSVLCLASFIVLNKTHIYDATLDDTAKEAVYDVIRILRTLVGYDIKTNLPCIIDLIDGLKTHYTLEETRLKYQKYNVDSINNFIESTAILAFFSTVTAWCKTVVNGLSGSNSPTVSEHEEGLKQLIVEQSAVGTMVDQRTKRSLALAKVALAETAGTLRIGDDVNLDADDPTAVVMDRLAVAAAEAAAEAAVRRQQRIAAAAAATALTKSLDEDRQKEPPMLKNSNHGGVVSTRDRSKKKKRNNARKKKRNNTRKKQTNNTRKKKRNNTRKKKNRSYNKSNYKTPKNKTHRIVPSAPRKKKR